MQWLAEVCVKRPVFATVLSLVILVVGGVFYKQLGVDQFPKIDFPIILVSTVMPGSSPEDMERDVSEPIEAAVNTLSGVDELRSMSSEGVSSVIIQFVLEKNVDVAAQEVQQKINLALPTLPRGIDPPVVMKFDPDAQPILFIAVRAPGKDVADITDLADRVVKRRLETVNGVGQATIIGGRKRQVNVLVDPVKLKGLGISPLEVAGAINAQNITLPGGRVDVSRDYLSVRVLGRVASVDELKSIIVRDQQGRAVRLDELATVEDGVEDADSGAFWNGERTVLVALRKQSGTNTVAVAEAARDRLADIQKELPAGYTLEVQRDGSQVIKTAADAVTEHLILGAFFAAVVVLVFLGNLRSTIIAALAIPTSIVGTFALMKLQGYTLNSITLLALALAVGIVIDDAIVVLENIFKHVEEHGEHPKDAAVKGTKEIGLAVLATTLSLIAVFVPIAFIGGIPGRFLGPFGVTMAFSIAVSLFVSFTMTPSLAARFLKPHQAKAEKPPLERLVDIFYRPIERAYVVMLKFAMAHRWVIVLASVAALGACVPLTMKAKKGFLPVDDRAQFEVVVRLPEGRSVAATELVGERVARLMREMPEVTATLLTIGDDQSRTPNLARIYVKLLPPDQRAVTQDAMKNRVREKILPALPPDLRVTVADVNEFGGGMPTARIQYLLAGPDLKVLEAANTRVLERIKKEATGAVDVDSSMVVGKPELGVYVDRERAADLGVQVVDIAQALQYLVAGQKVSTYSEGGEQYDVRLRAAPEYRTSEDALRLITVPSRKLGLVTLADVVKVRSGEGPATISRFQRERQITFMANAGPGYGDGDVGDKIKSILEDEVSRLPAGFTAKAQGQTKIMREVFVSFLLGLLASFVFMYLILAAQFESWLHPVTILVSLPLTLPFAVLSIVLFNQAIDLYSFLGIFVLFGVVKKNAILQIDHTNQLREKGLPRAEAILKGNTDRLRPILMTTLAFVAGMIPLITARGIGSGFSRATAGVVVGGQVLSLLLTLLAVPVVYSFFDDISLWFKRVRGLPAEEHPVGSHVAAPMEAEK
ncbi:MAG: acriflavin resistance protein [Myxococcaceae bacterium]